MRRRNPLNDGLIVLAEAEALELVRLHAQQCGPRGAQALGMFTVYIFLCVIGAFCDITALRGLGSLGVSLMIFASIAVLVHGLMIFGAARIMKLDPDMAAMASTANVGGGITAPVVARSLGRQGLVLPWLLC